MKLVSFIFERTLVSNYYLDDCVLQNAKYSGGVTIQEWRYDDWMQCSNNCRDDPRCAVWIWKQSKQCFTKEGYDTIDNEVGTIAGPKGCDSGTYCATMISFSYLIKS